MFGSPRITTSALAQLCRRLSTSLEAGLDVRAVWKREIDRASGQAAKSRVRLVSDAVSRGDNMSEALAATGDFFPPLFRELAEVGDQSGHLGQSFRHLAEHYERQLDLRRKFLAAITWPLVQLAASLAIIGFLIWIMGAIGQSTGVPVDPLGFGLVGNRGLLIYVAILVVIAAGLFAVFRAIGRGLAWTRPIQRAVVRVPVLGDALQTLALARMAWSLHLTLDAGMEVRRALRLSVRSTRNARYTDHLGSIEAAIGDGNSIYDAFVHTGSYPREFLDAVQVGEQAGTLVESMGLLSRQYHDRADSAMKTLTTLAAFGVWAAIAAVIIMFIFRLAFFYIGTIQSAIP